jgi:hypothetical protein
MTFHRVFDFRRVASFIAVPVVIFALSSCGKDGGKDAGCDGATRGCVQLVNPYDTALDVAVDGKFVGTLPGGSALAPGTIWVSIDSTVGTAATFAVAVSSLVQSSICTVTSSTWADPNVPPKVQTYWISGSLRPPSCLDW